MVSVEIGGIIVGGLAQQVVKPLDAVFFRQGGELGIQVGTQAQTVALDLTAQSSQLKAAVNDLNKQLTNSEAIFGIHEKTNRVTIKIVDKETKEVLKEYPPEQTLDMIAKVWEIAGILVDEKR